MKGWHVITPDGVSRMGKVIGWGEIDKIHIITYESVGGIAEVWVKSKDFTGIIHLSLYDIERVKGLITKNMAPEKISFGPTPSSLAWMRVSDVFVKVVCFAWIAVAVVQAVKYHPSPRDLFKSAADLAGTVNFCGCGHIFAGNPSTVFHSRSLGGLYTEDGFVVPANRIS